MNTSATKIASVSLGLLASLLLALDTSARVFVATNSTWSILKGTSEASTPTNAWRELDFDDSAWLVGAAPFHFGTNAVGGDDTLTGGTILSDMRSNYTCLFLRQKFVLSDTNSVRGLWLNAWIDDGLAIWINGQAARTPLSVGGLAYTNTATNSREGTTRNALVLSNTVGLLRAGTNVLCLQAFNRSLTDDDFRIDVELAETPAAFALATAAYTVREGATQVVVRVVRSGALDAGMSVNYATTNGSAVAGSDYEAVSGTLVFAEGQTEQTITVRIFNDGLVEGPEDFQLRLSNPGGGAILGSVSNATVQIADLIIRHPTTVAVFRGSNPTFAVLTAGAPPVAYQWRLDGLDLPDQTNATCSIVAAQPTNEGDYSVVVTDALGRATSDPARLWVVPPPTSYIRRDFTNGTGQRLPYFYWPPPDYDPSQRYPMIIHVTGGGMNEDNFMADAGTLPEGSVFQSYRQQSAQPCFLVFPMRRSGETIWSESHLPLVLGLAESLIREFNIDTNRIHLLGLSDGGGASVGLLERSPNFFASVYLIVGRLWTYTPSVSTFRNVPLWAFHAVDDTIVSVNDSRSLVSLLRQAGGQPIYTEYSSGGHSCWQAALCIPTAVDWFLAQRRGVVSTVEPLLSIVSPSPASVHTTAATTLSLTGSAGALGRGISLVTWTNLANMAAGIASGASTWSAAGIPLATDKTNLVIVTATTTSWTPAFGGNTTFNDTLSVVFSPIRATLAMQGPEAILSWRGGAPPYSVQRATRLAAGDWADLLTNAVPPLRLLRSGNAEFYRIIGH